MPDQFTGTTELPSTQPSVTNPKAVEIIHWWATFNDAELNSLVTRAMAANLDLKQAEARLRQARASRGVTAADFWPQVATNDSYTRSGTKLGGDQNLFRVGVDAAWELDIFGGVRRNIEASEADIQAALEDRRDVLVSVAAEVAIDYATLRGFQQQTLIARDNLKTQQHSLDLTKKRLIGGLVSKLDVANAEAQAATTESTIPQFEAAAQQQIYAISVLLGLEPAALLKELSPDGKIPTTPPAVPVGLPSDLLRRRPDIRRAEAQAHAATARIGVATADLFPKFSLTGSLGLESDQLKSLANWSSHFYSFGPSVSWPIFDAGRITSNIKLQEALRDQSVLTYRQTILNALQDVDSALVVYAKEQQHREALQRAVAANLQAVDLATRLYTQGQTNFLNVLDAQRSLFSTQDALVQSDRAMATNLAALYKALGGGWEDNAYPATQPATTGTVASAQPAPRLGSEIARK